MYLKVWWRELDNFDKIKEEMAQARKSAEQKSNKKDSVKQEAITLEQAASDEISITITPAINKKKRKKAVNYYLSVDLIDEIERKAQKYNKRNSVFLEELLRQVVFDI